MIFIILFDPVTLEDRIGRGRGKKFSAFPTRPVAFRFRRADKIPLWPCSIIYNTFVCPGNGSLFVFEDFIWKYRPYGVGKF